VTCTFAAEDRVVWTSAGFVYRGKASDGIGDFVALTFRRFPCLGVHNVGLATLLNGYRMMNHAIAQYSRVTARTRSHADHLCESLWAGGKLGDPVVGVSSADVLAN
jgi:hypothetical protein